MASSKDRQRKLARAKLDRQMTRRAGQERRRRRVQAGVGAGVAVLVVAGGVAWLGGAFDPDPASDPTASAVCAWTPQDTGSNTELKDVGTPPTDADDVPMSGVRPMTITTNQGAPITVGLDALTAPCSAASLAHLAAQKFYDGTDCSEITTFGALRCGDPGGNGLGGPAYSVYDENVPAAADPSASPAPDAAAPVYPKGTVAFIGNPPGTNGSQFLIFTKDYTPPAAPEYSVVGTVTGGDDTLAAIAKIPTEENAAGDKVKPTKKITIETLTVGDAAAAPAPSASNPAS